MPQRRRSFQRMRSSLRETPEVRRRTSGSASANRHLCSDRVGSVRRRCVPSHARRAAPRQVLLQSTRPVGVPPFKLGLSPLAFVVANPSSTSGRLARRRASTQRFLPASSRAMRTSPRTIRRIRTSAGSSLRPGSSEGKKRNAAIDAARAAMLLGAAKNYLFAIVQRPNVLATPSPAPARLPSTEYRGTTGVSVIQHVTAGPDGNLWFIEEDGSIGESVAKFTTTGKITRYPLKGAAVRRSQKHHRRPRRKYAVYRNEQFQDRKMTTDGVLTEYPRTMKSSP